MGWINYDEDIAAQRQEAFDDGLSKGVSQGISQGIQQKAIETAKNMFAKNIPLKIIAECTGLPLETIENPTKELLVKN